MKEKTPHYHLSPCFAEMEKNYVRLKPEDISDEGALNLAEAMIGSISDDYENYVKQAKENPKDKRTALNWYNLISYIRSDDFNALTMGNGPAFASQLERTYGYLSNDYYNFGRKCYEEAEAEKEKKKATLGSRFKRLNKGIRRKKAV